MRSMWWRAGLWSALALGCTKPNPNSCEDGVCTDPAKPYCDLDGTVSGTPKACVAVSCMAGQFQACSADSAITCNATGDNYDTVQCAMGCDSTVGCRACAPNETVCANGAVQTCDATGAVSASQTCRLGCFEDQPRCRDIDPSNSLYPYLAMAAAGPDLTMDGGYFFVPNGQMFDGNSNPTAMVTVVRLPAPLDGAPVLVVPVHSLTVTGTVLIQPDRTQNDNNPAIAFVVADKVDIEGTIRLESNATDQDNDFATPGALTSGECVGAVGHFENQTDAYFSGGGGGGGATQGGAGGAQFFPASAGGAASVHPDLQPLRGGCLGGSSAHTYRSHGGGALQISSATSIHLGPNSVIDANGMAGFAISGDVFTETIPNGGGSGGGILLEAPSVSLDSGVMLLANGGAGASGDGHMGTAPSGRLPSTGGVCVYPAIKCTNGGDGGSLAGPGRTAGSIVYTNQQELYTGAGGGAIGIIRINTTDAAFTQASDTYLSPAPTTGLIKTR